MKKELKDYTNILKLPYHEIIRIIFSPIELLKNKDKSEFYFREDFISFLEQKYDFFLKDINKNIEIKEKLGRLYIINISIKKDLFFFFVKNDNDDLNSIKFTFSKDENKYLMKNKGRSFIFLYTDNTFILLNTKDYFDLYLTKNKEKDKYFLTSDCSESSGKSIFKRLKIHF